MTSDLQIIAAAFKQGGGGVPLLRESINAVKEGKTAHPEPFQLVNTCSPTASNLANGQIRESSGEVDPASSNSWEVLLSPELTGSRDDKGSSH